MAHTAAKKGQAFPSVNFKDTVGIELNGKCVRLIHARVLPYHREVVAAVSRDLGTAGDADISKIIREIYGSFRLKQAEIVTTIPGGLAITKNIEIPSSDPREIREIINLQAGRHTPYAREEIIVDYVDLGSVRHSYSKILLVIVARSAVKRQVDLIERAGLRVEKVYFAPEGLAWAVSKVLKIENTDVPLAAVHIDENTTDFVLVLKGRALFVRSIPLGIRHLLNEEEKCEVRFAEEIRRSLEAYQSEDIDKKPTLLVVIGTFPKCASLLPALENVVGLPVKLCAYYEHSAFSAALQKSIAQEQMCSYVTLSAALFAGDDLKVDLSSEEIKVRKAFQHRARELMKAGLLVSVFFILACVLLAAKVSFKRAYLKQLQTRSDTLAGEVRELEKDFGKIGLIRNFFLLQGYSLDVLSELYAVTPEDVQFSDIRFDNELGRLAVRGSAASMSTVFSFTEKLEQSKYFKDAQTKNTTKRKEGAKEITDFEITCGLEGGRRDV